MDADVAATASLFGDRTRAAFLLALSEADALPLSDLAARAGVTPATASVHLSKLLEAGLVGDERHGRHRYFRLAGPPVAEAIEALAAIAPVAPTRSLRDATVGEALRAGRTCYDHLAGRVGVELGEALERRRLLVPEGDRLVLTKRGKRHLAELGLDLSAVAAARRMFARRCLDWSERRYHVAGALGAALTDRLFALGWIERHGSSRAVRVTEAGRRGLRARFGLDL